MFERHLPHDMTDAERRISNVVMIGQVKELDEKKARVRVQAGPILTTWIPFAARRASLDRTWHAPEPGEQVVMVAPGGDLNQAVVVGSIYREHYPAPADDADITRTVWHDGAILEYDRERHYWHLLVPSFGTVHIEIVKLEDGKTKSRIEMSDDHIELEILPHADRPRPLHRSKIRQTADCIRFEVPPHDDEEHDDPRHGSSIEMTNDYIRMRAPRIDMN